MYFSLVTFLSLISLAQAWQSCSFYWPNIKPGQRFTVKDNCRILPGYPKFFGKGHIKVTVTYTVNWSRQPSKTKDAVKPVLEESLKKTIERYQEFAKLPEHIVVILTTSVDGNVVADTIYPNVRASPCQIKFNQVWTTETAKNKAGSLQALAHEMYHCVQGLSDLEDYMEPQWLLDGSANYFSNLVFPNSNLEWPDKKHSGTDYNPSLPIYAHAGLYAYTTSIFFQSLEKKVNAKSLNEFVISTPGGSTGLDERHRLSGLAHFTDYFFHFSKTFALGRIQDTNKAFIPIKKMTPKPAPVDQQGTTGTVTLTSTPFTISVFEVTVDADQVAHIYSSANDHQRLAYRRPDDKTWTEMATSPSGRAEDKPCNTKRTKETLIILFISTADEDSDEAKVTIPVSREKKCGGKQSGFVMYPLYNSKTGGGYCPPKTHSSRLAIWCCPDGMQLDEKVASEASICCPTDADCSGEVVPKNLRCADPNWVLWNKEDRQLGCCPPGLYPSRLRYCVESSADRDPRFVRVT